MSTSGRAALATAAVAVAAVAALSSLVSEDKPQAPAQRPTFHERKTCLPGGAVVCDALETSVGGRGAARYRSIEVATKECEVTRTWSDGGVETVALPVETVGPRVGLAVVPGSCVPAATVTGPRASDGGVWFLPHRCACRKASGACQYRNDAGALADAPQGRTLGPGYPPFESWTGAGCQPRSCVEMAGESGWPSNCPG